MSPLLFFPGELIVREPVLANGESAMPWNVPMVGSYQRARTLAANFDRSTVTGAAVASSLLFFVVVDFGIWLMGDMYPRTFAGLVTCYTAALPFLRNQMVGDLLYTAVLFGGFALLERQFPVLKQSRPQPA